MASNPAVSSKNKDNNADFDDYTISPVIRQSLQHWGYKITKKDLE